MSASAERIVQHGNVAGRELTLFALEMFDHRRDRHRGHVRYRGDDAGSADGECGQHSRRNDDGCDERRRGRLAAIGGKASGFIALRRQKCVRGSAETSLLNALSAAGLSSRCQF